MRNFVSFFSVAFFLLLLWQCNPMFESRDEQAIQREEVRDELEINKRELAEELRDCSNSIERKIILLDEDLKNANDQTRKPLTDLKRKLKGQKLKVDRSIKEIEVATNSTWKKTSEKSELVLTDAKIEAQKIEERIEDLVLID